MYTSRFKGLLRRFEDVESKASELSAEMAEKVLYASQDLCPVRTGELRDSGHLEETPNGVAVVYDAPHALTIHERLDLPHPTGQAKFLEQPTLEAAPEFFQKAMDLIRGK